VEPIILIILVVLLVLFVVWGGGRSLGGLIANAIVGIVLLFLTNLFITPPIPINILTVLICAVGGVLGWLVILLLHVLGIAFYV
jgi:hypothetical protein